MMWEAIGKFLGQSKPGHATGGIVLGFGLFLLFKSTSPGQQFFADASAMDAAQAAYAVSGVAALALGFLIVLAGSAGAAKLEAPRKRKRMQRKLQKLSPEARTVLRYCVRNRDENFRAPVDYPPVNELVEHSYVWPHSGVPDRRKWIFGLDSEAWAFLHQNRTYLESLPAPSSDDEKQIERTLGEAAGRVGTPPSRTIVVPR